MKLLADVNLTPEILAKAFWEMDDESQAQFFIEVGKTASRGNGCAAMQWHYIGKHLKTCPCSTFEARLMVEGIYGAMSE